MVSAAAWKMEGKQRAGVVQVKKASELVEKQEWKGAGATSTGQLPVDEGKLAKKFYV